jgi:[ribosomal protein S5]-alanine N-acetyltransferase
MRVRPLETDRLVIRPFVMDDLDAIHRILDIELAEAETGTEGAKTREERGSWLQWTVLAYEELARLHQPPYGDRALALRGTREVVGACGYVPCLAPFDQIPALRLSTDPTPARMSTEFGLYWAISPAHQCRGYATEAARAMIAYAFAELGLARVAATTSYDNAPSIGVMRKVGMQIETNPYPDPPWFQVVGVLHHPT